MVAGKKLEKASVQVQLRSYESRSSHTFDNTLGNIPSFIGNVDECVCSA